MLDAASFFDLTDLSFKDVFADTKYVWEGLKNLKAYMDGVVFGPTQEVGRGGSWWRVCWIRRGTRRGRT
jgi:hypothetical protein